MAISNYSELKTAVSNWLHRGDLTSVIPDFIMLAENRINGDLDARLQDTKTTLTCTANDESVAMPSDVINIRHLSVVTTPIYTLDYTTPDQFETQYAYGDSGIPQIYTVIGTDLYLAPKPDSAYSLDLIYKARIPSLSDSVTTNWLITSYPHVYLYATLLEATPYIKDDSRLQVWLEAYREAIQSVNNQDWYSGSTMRVRTDVRPT